MTLHLRVTSMRLQMEEFIDEVHDQGNVGVMVAAIASHLGVTVPEVEAKP